MCPEFINNDVTDNERVKKVEIRCLSALGWTTFTFYNTNDYIDIKLVI